MKRPSVKSARVHGHVVELTLTDGSIVERDFVFVTGPAFRRWWREDGIDPRVHVTGSELWWPGDIDFSLDHVLWGSSPRRRRPLRRAVVAPQGMLIAAPWVRSL